MTNVSRGQRRADADRPIKVAELLARNGMDRPNLEGTARHARLAEQVTEMTERHLQSAPTVRTPRQRVADRQTVPIRPVALTPVDAVNSESRKSNKGMPLLGVLSIAGLAAGVGAVMFGGITTTNDLSGQNAAAIGAQAPGAAQNSGGSGLSLDTGSSPSVTAPEGGVPVTSVAQSTPQAAAPRTITYSLNDSATPSARAKQDPTPQLQTSPAGTTQAPAPSPSPTTQQPTTSQPSQQQKPPVQEKKKEGSGLLGLDLLGIHL
ncbi:hypothetical protein D5S17_11780 [Pseudonocardiaceae bacterium YIM PH 21723]|nr:hypothetical protein D5S17_11780 [Pseudonocardiaceae bacterium YIM PH 21723]